MNEKKIEPTQAMVDIVDLADKLMVMDTRDLLRTALNHPDAAGLEGRGRRRRHRMAEIR